MILKLKKFIIFLVCVILVVSLFTFSVSAELSAPVGTSVYISEASASIVSLNPGFGESTSRFPVDILRSPTGGNFYAFSWNGTKSYDIASLTQNMYFYNSYPITVHETYRVKLNVVLPFAAAAYSEVDEITDGALSYNLFFRWWHLMILDTNGYIRLSREFYDTDFTWWDQMEPYNNQYGFSVQKAQSTISGNTARFFFIPFEFTFVASGNYSLNHINFGFTFKRIDPDVNYTLNSGGYYGISDFSIEKLDPSNTGAVIFNAVDDIKNTTRDIRSSVNLIFKSIDDLPSDIQSVLRSELTYLLNEQRKMYNEYKNSFDKAFNDKKYDEVDDSDVNREHQLTSEIEDLTESGRDVAVETIDSAGEILSNSVTDPSDQSGSSIENGLFVWTRILDTVFQRVPWFGTMVQFSLSLGLFSFLMGIITYAVGKTSNKNNHNKNNSKSTTPALKKGK